MGYCFSSSLLFLSCAISILFISAHSGPLPSVPISPNFTASYFLYIDTSGSFLLSSNGTFKASITNIYPETFTYYFVVQHASTNEVIWSANRNNPVSNSSKLYLTSQGLTLRNDEDQPVWSSSSDKSGHDVMSLELLESGNLVLLDKFGSPLWQSFDYPTDTIVVGQSLYAGKSLVSSSDERNTSDGDNKFTVTDDGSELSWKEMVYYRLSMDTRAYRDTNFAVEYMKINDTGMFWIGRNGTRTVFHVSLDDVSSDNRIFRIVKLDDNGALSVKTFTGGNWVTEFTAPDDSCRIASVCKKAGVCGSRGSCSCPPGFHNSQNGECVPIDTRFALPVACDENIHNGDTDNTNNQVSFLRIGNKIDYFANDFTGPVMYGLNLPACENLCSRNCSCLGIFHDNASGSCYLIRNHLGSFRLKGSESERSGYIKAILVSSPVNMRNGNTHFPVLGLVLLPSSGVLIILVIAAGIALRRRRRKKLFGGESGKLGRWDSGSSGEIEFVSIPGLPVRFDYEDLVVATQNFSNQIGTGGFGTVYKGTLADGLVVAVKKITCLGAHGKREFCTEIAVIGKIHHVNLVRLRGFCAQRGQRFLVYEYMNRGSLDRTLFGNGPPLEWRERFEIALGTARGLAYLHCGCEHKIIHCDVKPENILLHDNLQVKISDFGLSKLLSPEESGLFTTMRGTRGYLAPEWLTSSVISDKSDVYSYGMVLLELVRGKKNSSIQTQSHCSGDDSSGQNGRSSSSGSGHRLIYFPLFALEMHEEKRYLDLVDARLLGRVTSEEVEKLVKVALCCVQEDPMLRPTMTNVVSMLEGGLAVSEPRLQSLNFLRFYGRRFTEASVMEGTEQSEFLLHRQTTGTSDSPTLSSHNSFSYMTSQQVSGPR